MDLSETTAKVLNRHPWELSRTKCVLDAFGVYINSLHKRAKNCSYINAGAGDLYFDKALLKRYKKDEVHAIDIAYENMNTKNKRIHKYHYVEEIQEESFDYAIMMDSLEYMEDDVAYVRKICKKIKKGGYFLLTLPAFPILFSDYDVNIKNLRRYDRKSFQSVLDKVPELKKVEEYYFYSSLFLVRFMQKMLHLPIDPSHRFTANWKYRESGFVTRFLTDILNLDFKVNKLLSKIGVRLPGLSMLVICRKM